MQWKNGALKVGISKLMAKITMMLLMMRTCLPVTRRVEKLMLTIKGIHPWTKVVLKPAKRRTEEVYPSNHCDKFKAVHDYVCVSSAISTHSN